MVILGQFWGQKLFLDKNYILVEKKILVKKPPKIWERSPPDLKLSLSLTLRFFPILHSLLPPKKFRRIGRGGIQGVWISYLLDLLNLGSSTAQRRLKISTWKEYPSWTSTQYISFLDAPLQFFSDEADSQLALCCHNCRSKTPFTFWKAKFVTKIMKWQGLSRWMKQSLCWSKVAKTALILHLMSKLYKYI